MSTLEIETTSNLKYKVSKTYGNTRLVVNIRLNDECKNGHEDFAITGETYVNGREDMGGCIHDTILRHFPQFKPFVDLHLSDADGAPMYATANGFYHYQQKNEHTQAHIRATDAEWKAITDAEPRTEDEFSFILEELGFRAKWEKEALEAIALLEELTGKTFESAAIKYNWPRLSPEKVALIRERRASGYYEPEAIVQRDKEAVEAARAKKLASLAADRDKRIKEINDGYAVSHYFISRGINNDNIIYYNHTNKIRFNWRKDSSYNKIWTQEEFMGVVNSADYSQLPEGVSFEIK